MVKLLPCEGALSGQHLVRHDPEGPQVVARIDRPSLSRYAQIRAIGTAVHSLFYVVSN